MSRLCPVFKSNPPPLPSESHFISLVHCSKSPLHLKQIHAHLLRRRLPLTGRLAAQLVAACSPLRSMSYALSVFHHRQSPSSPYSPLFDALIRALSENFLFSSALSHFALMARSGLLPGRLAFPFALKSAASLPTTSIGASLHAFAAKLGVDLDPFVRTSLVDMYVKLGSPVLALQVFDDTPEWHRSTNVLIWNVSISACCQLGDLEGARRLFETMPMPEKSVSSWNSLIHGYMRKGNVEQAAELFSQMPERNVVSWTTMVSGFSQLGENERALQSFDEMLEAGIRPNNYTIASVLSACARMGALECGIRIHEYVLRNGFRADGAVGTALIDMYSKCGKIDCASDVFEHMKERDILTWTAMIMGWAVHGNWKQAHQCFEDMKCACVKPDGGVFLAMLMACSHSGKVEQGLELFDSMRFDYRIEPNVKHYTCMVDLFGRDGRLHEALAFMEAMPIEPDFIVWGALFNACQVHKNVELAEFAAEKLLKLKPKHQGSYIFLSNAYAGAGRWEDAEKVRISMKDRGMELSPGWSNIEGGDPYTEYIDELHKDLLERHGWKLALASTQVERLEKENPHKETKMTESNSHLLQVGDGQLSDDDIHCIKAEAGEQQTHSGREGPLNATQLQSTSNLSFKMLSQKLDSYTAASVDMERLEKRRNIACNSI